MDLLVVLLVMVAVLFLISVFPHAILFSCACVFPNDRCIHRNETIRSASMIDGPDRYRYRYRIIAEQKSKELGLTSNEWNYRMSKRDEAYKQYEARVRAEMDSSSALNNSLRVQKS